jgi:hypothetical protein
VAVLSIHDEGDEEYLAKGYVFSHSSHVSVDVMYDLSDKFCSSIPK